jgi:ABC-2 type transport system ATP-binding protein
MESTDLKPRIRELLSEVGLWERRRETAGTWSRGMKQKLAVARALLHHPELVFLDEPTAGQDPQSAAEFRQSLVALAKREGVTVFLTTHNLVEAERICDRVAVIRQGKLLAVGAPAQLRSHGSKPRLEVVGRNFKPATIAALRKLRGISSAETRNGSLILQLDGNVSVAPIVKKLVASGAEVEEVRRETKSLEDFFLSLIKEEA